MKQLYKVDEITYCLHIKSGDIIKKKDHNGRFMYKYGEVPVDYKEEYTDWESFVRAFNYVDTYHGSKTKFKKRIYINDYTCGFNRVYKDQFEKFIVETKYKVFQDTDFIPIDILEKDLGFMDYSQLVFERENELKKMLLYN